MLPFKCPIKNPLLLHALAKLNPLNHFCFAAFEIFYYTNLFLVEWTE